MPARNLEEAYRDAVAERRRTRAELAEACVPFLVDSTFRARRTSPAVVPERYVPGATDARCSEGSAQ